MSHWPPVVCLNPPCQLAAKATRPPCTHACVRTTHAHMPCTPACGVFACCSSSTCSAAFDRPCAGHRLETFSRMPHFCSIGADALHQPAGCGSMRCQHAQPASSPGPQSASAAWPALRTGTHCDDDCPLSSSRRPLFRWPAPASICSGTTAAAPQRPWFFAASLPVVRFGSTSVD